MNPESSFPPESAAAGAAAGAAAVSSTFAPPPPANSSNNSNIPATTTTVMTPPSGNPAHQHPIIAPLLASYYNLMSNHSSLQAAINSTENAIAHGTIAPQDLEQAQSSLRHDYDRLSLIHKELAAVGTSLSSLSQPQPQQSHHQAPPQQTAQPGGFSTFTVTPLAASAPAKQSPKQKAPKPAKQPRQSKLSKQTAAQQLPGTPGPVAKRKYIKKKDRLAMEQQQQQHQQQASSSTLASTVSPTSAAEARKRTKTRKSQEEIEQENRILEKLGSPELQHAFHIVVGMRSPQYHSFSWPFLEPVDVEGMGLVDYHRVIPHPMDLTTVYNNLADCKYLSISDVVRDLRLIIANCIKYNGLDHEVSKMAKRLEIVLEQKLTLLPLSIRDKTTLAKTSPDALLESVHVPTTNLTLRSSVAPIDASKHTHTQGQQQQQQHSSASSLSRAASQHAGKSRSGSASNANRHLHPLFTSSLSFSSLSDRDRLIASMRKRLGASELIDPSRVFARDVVSQQMAEAAAVFDETVPGNALRQFRSLWQVPAIGHILTILQHYLPGVSPFSFFDLEMALLYPTKSSSLHKLMVALLNPTKQTERVLNHARIRKETIGPDDWVLHVGRTVEGWYRRMARTLRLRITDIPLPVKTKSGAYVVRSLPGARPPRGPGGRFASSAASSPGTKSKPDSSESSSDDDDDDAAGGGSSDEDQPSTSRAPRPVDGGSALLSSSSSSSSNLLLQQQLPLSLDASRKLVRKRVKQMVKDLLLADDEVDDFERELLLMLGKSSPLAELNFAEIDVRQRVWIMYALCMHQFDQKSDIVATIDAYPASLLRTEPMGFDDQGNAYYFFPELCTTDYIVYRQCPTPPKHHTVPPPAPPAEWYLNFDSRTAASASAKRQSAAVQPPSSAGARPVAKRYPNGGSSANSPATSRSASPVVAGSAASRKRTASTLFSQQTKRARRDDSESDDNDNDDDNDDDDGGADSDGEDSGSDSGSNYGDDAAGGCNNDDNDNDDDDDDDNDDNDGDDDNGGAENARKGGSRAKFPRGRKSVSSATSPPDALRRSDRRKPTPNDSRDEKDEWSTPRSASRSSPRRAASDAKSKISALQSGAKQFGSSSTEKSPTSHAATVGGDEGRRLTRSRRSGEEALEALPSSVGRRSSPRSATAGKFDRASKPEDQDDTAAEEEEEEQEREPEREQEREQEDEEKESSIPMDTASDSAVKPEDSNPSAAAPSSLPVAMAEGETLGKAEESGDDRSSVLPAASEAPAPAPAFVHAAPPQAPMPPPYSSQDPARAKIIDEKQSLVKLNDFGADGFEAVACSLGEIRALADSLEKRLETLLKGLPGDVASAARSTLQANAAENKRKKMALASSAADGGDGASDGPKKRGRKKGQTKESLAARAKSGGGGDNEEEEAVAADGDDGEDSDDGNDEDDDDDDDDADDNESKGKGAGDAGENGSGENDSDEESEVEKRTPEPVKNLRNLICELRKVDAEVDEAKLEKERRKSLVGFLRDYYRDSNPVWPHPEKRLTKKEQRAIAEREELEERLREEAKRAQLMAAAEVTAATITATDGGDAPQQDDAPVAMDVSA